MHTSTPTINKLSKRLDEMTNLELEAEVNRLMDLRAKTTVKGHRDSLLSKARQADLELCKRLGIKNQTAAVHYPQDNVR
jgi:hypothetical protein